jgi:hypothetical protein
MANGYYNTFYDYNAFTGIPTRFVQDIEQIIQASGLNVKGRGGKGEPIVTLGRVLINGDAEKDENGTDFILTGEGLVNAHTQLKPYDLVVRTILLRGMTYRPDRFLLDMEESKEDGIEENWAKAFMLYERLFGDWVPAKDMTFSDDELELLEEKYKETLPIIEAENQVDRDQLKADIETLFAELLQKNIVKPLEQDAKIGQEDDSIKLSTNGKLDRAISAADEKGARRFYAELQGIAKKHEDSEAIKKAIEEAKNNATVSSGLSKPEEEEPEEANLPNEEDVLVSVHDFDVTFDIVDEHQEYRNERYDYSFTYNTFTGVSEILLEDIKKIVEAVDVRISGPQGYGSPILDQERVDFNIAGSSDAMTRFLLTYNGEASVYEVNEEDPDYALLIQTILLRATHYRNDDDVLWADEVGKGAIQERWGKAFDLYNEIFGENWVQAKAGDFDENSEENVKVREAWIAYAKANPEYANN